MKRGLGEINLEGGLDICLNMEISQHDPAGTTVPYRLLVPRLWYEEGDDVDRREETMEVGRVKGNGGLMRWASVKGRKDD